MKLDDLLEYQTPEEAIDAIDVDLAQLVHKSRRARDAGDSRLVETIHRLLDEDLDMRADFEELLIFDEPDNGHDYPVFSDRVV